MVHVENVAVAEAFDVLVHVDDLLQVLVLAVVEDGVVDDDAVDFGVGVSGEDGFFNVVARDVAEGVAESAVDWERRGMLVGCDEQWAVHALPPISHASERSQRRGQTQGCKSTHCSRQVFSVHWAYINAAGSLLAKKPTR